MAWKRTKKGKFTPAQHEKMRKMYHVKGMRIPEIAETAGCSTNSVRRSVGLMADQKKTKVRRKRKTKTKRKTKRKTVAGPAKSAAEANVSYYQWVAKGAINGWVDRVIGDIKNGHLT